MLCPPSQVNLKISPPPASLPDTNRFCAEALEQIKIAAPNATMLKNCPTRLMADLNLVSVTFAFIIAPLFCFFVWLVSSFTEVVRKIRREVTRNFDVKPTDRGLRGCHELGSGRRGEPACWFRLPAETSFRSSDLPELRLALAVRSQSRVFRAIRVLSQPARQPLSRQSPTEDGSPAEVGEIIFVFPRRGFGKLDGSAKNPGSKRP